MARKIIAALVVAVLLALAGAGVYAYWVIWPGLKPAIGPLAKPGKVAVPPGAENTTGLPLILPSGFKIEKFAEGLGPVRLLEFDANGILLASVMREGKVVALPDLDRNGRADKTITLLEGLNNPHGLALKGNALYVAENDRLARYEYGSDKNGEISLGQAVKVADLPAGGGHITRTVVIGADGVIYVSAGSSSNNDLETDNRRAAVTAYDPDGSNRRVFATGLRNSVGLVWHPSTSELWGTDNGRDYMGDDLPPDEVNIIKNGGFYGWPYAYGNKLTDPAYGDDAKAAASLPPKIEIQAHSAPLGLCFFTGDAWGQAYRGDLFVCYHGSWNRSVPTGYKVVRYDLSGPTFETVKEQKDFISGWLTPGGALGRPVDIAQGPDDALYISDDKSGVVYRVSKLK